MSLTLRSDFPFITGLCGLYVESGDDGSLDAAFWERLTDASSKYEKEIVFPLSHTDNRENSLYPTINKDSIL